MDIGHNGGPDLNGDDDALVMLFVRFNINDILKTLLEIRSLEERGFYMTVLFVMYDRGGYLPSDDHAAARALAVDVRTYKRLKAILLKADRIKATVNGITQTRVQKEIERYTTEAMRRREAALQREERRRHEREMRALYEDFEGLPPGPERDAKMRSDGAMDEDRPEWDERGLHMRSAEDQPKIGPISGRSPGDVGRKSSKKQAKIDQDLFKNINKINGHATTAVVLDGPQPCHSGTRSLSISQEGIVERGSNTETPVYDEPSVASDAATRGKPEYTLDFIAFWASYPRKEGTSKKKAWQGWKKLGKADREAATNGLDAFKAHEERRLRKSPDSTGLHASTYINERRWETFGEQTKSGKTYWWENEAKRATVTQAQWVGLVRKWANGKWDIEKLGPPPGSRYCVVPEPVIEDLGLMQLYDITGALKPGAMPPWSTEVH